MADYNIYIHSLGVSGGASQSPTTPWSTGENGTFGSQGASPNSSGAFVGAARAATFLSNPDSIVSSAVGGFAKAIPYIAAAAAVVYIVKKVHNQLSTVQVIQSGDYREKIWCDNLRANFDVITHPFSSAYNSYMTQMQWQYENYKRQSMRELLGDSVINSRTKGV